MQPAATTTIASQIPSNVKCAQNCIWTVCRRSCRRRRCCCCCCCYVFFTQLFLKHKWIENKFGQCDKVTSSRHTMMIENCKCILIIWLARCAFWLFFFSVLPSRIMSARVMGATTNFVHCTVFTILLCVFFSNFFLLDTHKNVHNNCISFSNANYPGQFWRAVLVWCDRK